MAPDASDAIAASALPTERWVADSGSISLAYADPVASTVAAGKRYAKSFRPQPGHPLTVTRAQNVAPLTGKGNKGRVRPEAPAG